jgi:hypothetical protein
MNLRIAKAFRTTSSKTLCLLAALTPILIKTEKAVRPYNSKKETETNNQQISVTYKIDLNRQARLKLLKGKKTKNAQYSYTQVYSYTWVKARVGTCVKELGAQLAKEAAPTRTL